MIVSKNMLKDLCPNIAKISNQELLNAFTAVGLEVEKQYEHPKLKNFCIGYVKKVIKHPNSDTLNIATVIVEKEQELTIVCGGKNLINDRYVIVARVGAKLHNGLDIEKRVIRGVESFGMICSLPELTPYIDNNFDDSENIILIKKKNLEKNSEVGDTFVNKYFNLDDSFFDLSIPTNRSDLYGLYSLIKEISTKLNFTYNYNFNNSNLLDNISFNSIEKPNLLIETNKCTSFAYLTFKNKKIGINLTQKCLLASLGYKIQNNINDLIRLFFIQFGVPYLVINDIIDKKSSIKIIDSTEKINFIDNNSQAYDIPVGTPLIYFNDKLISVMGAIHNIETKKSQDTSILLFNFDKKELYDFFNQVKVETYNSKFFKRSHNNTINKVALIGLNNLIEITLKEKPSYDFIFKKSNQLAEPVLFDFEKAKNFIPFPMEKDQIYDKLKNSGFKFNGDYITPPWNRSDIENEYSIYSEIIKYINFNNLEVEPIPIMINTILKKDKKDLTMFNFSQKLLYKGFNELVTYELISEEENNLFNFFHLYKGSKLINPIAKNKSFIRINTVISILKNIQYNTEHKRKIQPSFEFFSVFDKTSSKYDKFLTLVITKDFVAKNSLVNAEIKTNLNTVKSFVYDLLSYYFDSIEFEAIKNSNVLGIETDQLISIDLKGKKIGYIAPISKEVLNNFKIKDSDSYVVTINFSKLENFINNRNKIKIIEPSIYQDSIKDLTLSLNIDVNLSDIFKIILNTDLVHRAELIDFYENDDKKMYTIRIELRTYKEKFTAQIISNIINNIKTDLNQKCFIKG